MSAKTMKAATRGDYGPTESVGVTDVATPEVDDDGLLVRVRAASVNPYDWHIVTGMPYIARIASGLRRPKSALLGADFAGTVEAVGARVTEFRSGDEVFGVGAGAFAECISVRADGAVAAKPANLTFEEAAAVPLAGITALQGLRDKGRLQPGQRVLINGASGGVGTFAVQIARALGAEVTAVCSSRNIQQASALGAAPVIDYTREDFTRSAERFEVLLDIGGNRSWSACKRVLVERGVLVPVGGPKTNRFVGVLGRRLVGRLASVGQSRSSVLFLAHMNKDDLNALRELLEAGSVTPVIERRFPLDEVPEALGYVGAGHARGKVVITV